MYTRINQILPTTFITSTPTENFQWRHEQNFEYMYNTTELNLW